MLIYAITLGQSEGFDSALVNVSQFGWWVTLTSSLLWLRLYVWVKDTFLYWVTQENSIEFLLQSSLPYIPFGDGPY